MSDREFFTGTYRCEILDHLPITGATHQFYRHGEEPQREALAVRVTLHNGVIWTGNFQSPDTTLRSEIFPAPGGQAFFVLTGGRAYRVNPFAPTEYQVAPLEPIREYHLVVESALVVFYTFFRLAAYDPKGLLWKSERVNWDWLAVFSVTPSEIHCTGWNPETESYDQFILDTNTGERIDRPGDHSVSSGEPRGSRSPSFWKRVKTLFSRD